MSAGNTGKEAGQWVLACRADDIPLEDVRRFDFGERTFVIIRSPEGELFAMDGHCSHERIHLSGGLVDGGIIECPRHFGTFDYRTGESRKLPACVDLRIYPVREQDGEVFVFI